MREYIVHWKNQIKKKRFCLNSPYFLIFVHQILITFRVHPSDYSAPLQTILPLYKKKINSPVVLSVRNKKKSQGVRSGEYRGRLDNWCDAGFKCFTESGNFWSTVWPGGISVCTTPLQSKKQMCIVFMFDSAAQTFLGRGGPGDFHCLDCCFVSGRIILLRFINWVPLEQILNPRTWLQSTLPLLAGKKERAKFAYNSSNVEIFGYNTLNWTRWYSTHLTGIINGSATVFTKANIDFVNVFVTSWRWVPSWPEFVCNWQLTFKMW